MEQQTSIRDTGLEAFCGRSDTWRALNALLRLGELQHSPDLTQRDAVTAGSTLLSADWQALDAYELAVVTRWAKHCALGMAFSMGAALNAGAYGLTMQEGGPTHLPWLAGQLDLWIALTVLANHLEPLVADFNVQEL